MDKDWLVIIIELFYFALGILALFLKINWLLAVFFIITGIIAILASIFKWEEILFYSHFWIDLDENVWFRILNGIIGVLFIVGGIWLIGTELILW